MTIARRHGVAALMIPVVSASTVPRQER